MLTSWLLMQQFSVKMTTNKTKYCIYILLKTSFYTLFFLIVFQMLYYSTTFRKTDVTKTKIVPLIILKLPRSGSSWFTETLNDNPNIFISKEIIQHKDKLKYSSKAIFSHFNNALRSATGKISAISSLFSRRFLDDFIFNYKFLQFLSIVGFTVNPEHCQGKINIYMTVDM